MKLVTFETTDGPGVPRLGALHDGRIVDLRACDPRLPADMLGLLDAGQGALDAARQALRAPKRSYAQADVRLRAPLMPRALRDFFAFEEHALQGAKRRGEPLAPAWYEQPVYYKGNHREIYGPGETVPWPSYTRKMDFEFEIACVVGKRGRDIPVEEAAPYIAGYTILNDFSARDIQKNEMICRMGPAKAKDFANGLGPWLVTADELAPGEIDDLKMTLRVNGEVWSEGNSGGRYWKFPLMLSHVSQEETVYPGDVLGSGTYYRGCGLDLDRWVKPGDIVELTVDKLGTLSHAIGAPKAQKRLIYSAQEAGHGARR